MSAAVHQAMCSSKSTKGRIEYLEPIRLSPDSRAGLVYKDGLVDGAGLDNAARCQTNPHFG